MAEFDQRQMPGAGDLRERITILRRVVQPVLGQERGAFVEVLKRWALWRFTAARAVIEGGRSNDGAEGKFTVRDCSQTRLITHADRVRWNGQDYTIISVTPRMAGWPFIELFVTSARNG